MSLGDREILEIARLVGALEEGTLDGAEHEKLQEHLRGSNAARREYVRLCTMSASLHTYADEVLQGGGGQLPVRATRAAVSIRWPMSAKLALAAALVGMLALAGLLLNPGTGSTSGYVKEESVDNGCAVLTRSVGVRWGQGTPVFREGDTVPAGDLWISDGIAQFEFFTGATLVVEGAAHLQIRSAKEVFCTYGSLHATVLHHAKGFRVETPQLELVDLGTEFGIHVPRGGGEAEVVVFDGEVQVAANAGGRERLLTTGQAASVVTGGQLAVGDVARSQFADAGELAELTEASLQSRYVRWLSAVEGFRQDPRLIVYYPFLPRVDHRRLLENAGAGDVPGLDGSIVGCRWVEGRWPGKKALAFSGAGDRVRISVPGSYDAVTFAAWVRIGGLDRFYNSLFLTDQFSPGNPHWQIEHTGRLILGIKGVSNYQAVFFSPPVLGSQHSGRWIHLASSYDRKAGEGSHYINGEEVGRYEVELDTPIVIGNAELGNWGLPLATEKRAIRNLNGTVDEFMLFTEALTSSEIKQIYQEFTPETTR